MLFPRNKKFLITPLLPHTDHLSTTATFHCPQGGRCEEVRLHFIVLHQAIQRVSNMSITRIEGTSRAQQFSISRNKTEIGPINFTDSKQTTINLH